MNRKKAVMNFIFIDAIVVGVLLGHVISRHYVEEVWSMILSGGLAIFLMFIGMVLAFMVSDERQMEKRITMERSFNTLLQQIMLGERVNCAKVALSISRAMVDRVVNNILSNYIKDMKNSTKRQKILKDVNKLVSDEMDLMTTVLWESLGEEGKEGSDDNKAGQEKSV